ncbi:MAG: hypothetical protein Q9201_006907 [Fulgogasparrea decipioides]
MHFSSTYFALAFSLATGTFAIPKLVNTGKAATAIDPSLPTYSHGATDSVPLQCHMFAPYVPQALLGAVCSLHMTPLTPGQMPTLDSACFAGPVHTQGTGTSNQPTTTHNGGPEQTGHGAGQTHTQEATSTNGVHQPQQTNTLGSSTNTGGDHQQQTTQAAATTH